MEKKDYKKYFLGLMSAEDAEMLELQIISKEIAPAELLPAENELIEDYLEGNFTDEEVKAFNANFLITGERRERVKFVKLMTSYSRNEKKSAAPVENNKPSFFEPLKLFLAARRITLAFTSILLILTLGVAWQFLFKTNKNNVETELAALNKQDLSNLDKFKNDKNLSLVSGSLRSGGNVSSLSENDLTAAVLLRLALPNSAVSNDDFTVIISKDERVLKTFVQPSIGNQEVRLLVPKSILKKGSYQISLEKNGEKYNYFFLVI